MIERDAISVRYSFAAGSLAILLLAFARSVLGRPASAALPLLVQTLLDFFVPVCRLFLLCRLRNHASCLTCSRCLPSTARDKLAQENRACSFRRAGVLLATAEDDGTGGATVFEIRPRVAFEPRKYLSEMFSFFFFPPLLCPDCSCSCVCVVCVFIVSAWLGTAVCRDVAWSM